MFRTPVEWSALLIHIRGVCNNLAQTPGILTLAFWCPLQSLQANAGVVPHLERNTLYRQTNLISADVISPLVFRSLNGPHQVMPIQEGSDLDCTQLNIEIN
jgi:hypothetical protein